MRGSVLLLMLVFATASRAADMDQLREELRSEDWNVRRVAVLEIAETVPLTERILYLLPMWKDEHYQVRETAVEALYGSVRGVLREPLIELSNTDPHPNVRDAAVAGLAAFDGEDVQEAVVARIEDEHAFVRRRAIDWCRNHDSPTARGALAKALSDEEALNRLRAVDALVGMGAVGTAEYIAPLVTTDTDPRVRRAAGRAFHYLDSEIGLRALATGLSLEKDDEVRESFLKVLKRRTGEDFGEDSDAWIRWLDDPAR